MTARKSNPAAEPAEQELVITRVFDAPRELVFKTWTEPEHFVHWWGPKGFTTPHCKIDPRPGGVWHCCMRSTDGKDIWCGGVYREIVVPERIVCTDCFTDEKGNVVDPAVYGMPEAPKEMLLTVTLTEKNGRTTLTVKHSLPLWLAERMGAPQGWNSSFDRLAEYLAKTRALR